MSEVARPKHHKQIEALNDPARFKFWLAGRRGGKTVAIVEDILDSIQNCPETGEIFYIGPTNAQAIELVWEKLVDRLDQLRWRYETKISKQCFEFSRKRKLYIIGAEKIRRVRGHKLWAVYLDEVAFFTVPLSDVWKAVRPALSDLRGRAIVATTPNGKGTDAYDFYLNTRSKESWRYFHWYTEDNPFIDRAELEDAKNDLDERSYNQEYRASWESYEGLAYYNFDEQVHVQETEQLNFNQPIIFNFDFNVNPTTLLVSQRHGSILHFKKEFSQKRGSTEDTVLEACEWLDERLAAIMPDAEQRRLRKRSVMIKVRGDATGKSEKSNTGKSDYFYIKQVLERSGFQFQTEVPNVNPPIVDRVKHVNSWLKNIDGKSRIIIDKTCTELIRDLSSQETDGRYPSEKNNLGHKADALGYCVCWEHTHGDKPTQAPGMVARI